MIEVREAGLAPDRACASPPEKENPHLRTAVELPNINHRLRGFVELLIVSTASETNLKTARRIYNNPFLARNFKDDRSPFLPPFRRLWICRHIRGNRAYLHKVQSLYEDGVPLFTKDAIRDMGQQLKLASKTTSSLSEEKETSKGNDGISDENRRYISVRGLDGKMAKFKLSTGRIGQQLDEVERV